MGLFKPISLLNTVMSNKVRKVRKMLKRGIDPNQQEHQSKRIPLHYAPNASVEMVKLLIDHGADVNARDENDSTPLHTASVNGKSESARLLLANGAEVNARDNKGNTPLHRCTIEPTYYEKFLLPRGIKLEKADLEEIQGRSAVAEILRSYGGVI
jgi:ankyrin repeat protein